MLKGVKPELVQPCKPKFLMSGKAGVGKTMFALEFPSVYYIDTEGGATREQYRTKLSKSGGSYMGKEQGSQDFNTVIEEIKALATTKHEYKTLVIDSFSHLYLLCAAIAEETIGSDFGKDRKAANKPTRQLMRWLDVLDMNVILVCHAKDKWERKNSELICTGSTFEGFDKMEYALDLWVEVVKEKDKRFFIVKKSRIATFLEGAVNELSYVKFAELYGKQEVERNSLPMVMATVDQVTELKKLVEVMNIKQEIVDGWLSKASVDTIAELTGEQILKCIGVLKKSLNELSGKTEPKLETIKKEKK
jgi:hypothetical protein